MDVLVQFLFRLTFGLTVSMGLTSSRAVDSGFFRVHLWVALGLVSLATVILASGMGLPVETWEQQPIWAIACSTICSVLSYFGSIIWLYEKPKLGKIFIWIVAIASLLSAVVSLETAGSLSEQVVQLLDFFTSGLILGSTICAMLLGHWYLNNPGMKIKPLQLLVALILIATVARAAVCGIGISQTYASHDTTTLIFIALRWLWGIFGPLVLALMTWQTLKIPNTQSATGILYVGVICVFLGELSSQLLSHGFLFPL
ncbi:MAG: hypothetical protein ACKVH8_07340 [Pirellulales bacterium]